MRAIRINTKKKSRVFNNKQDWHEVGGRRIYFRSSWELKYAKFLQFLKENNTILDWEHEPQTFWFEEIKRGVRSYMPDFKVLRHDGSHYWVEVKGYMDSKSKTKIKRFKRFYSQEELLVVDSLWFNHHPLREIYEKKI